MFVQDVVCKLCSVNCVSVTQKFKIGSRGYDFNNFRGVGARNITKIFHFRLSLTAGFYSYVD